MKPSRLLLIAGLLLAPAVHAEDIPLRNWSLPETLSRQLDLTDGVPFVGIQPCRVVDTRPSQGFPAAWGPPILVANATRNFDINSAPHCSAIPANARAYSLNFTITEPVGPGDVRAWPAGNPAVVSIQNWGAANVTIANAAIVTAGTNGEITVQIGGSNSHLIIDINGYFSDTLNSPKFFGVTGSRSAGAMVFGQNTSATGVAFGGEFITNSTTSGAAGTRGRAIGTSGITYGTLGQTASVSNDSAGVRGFDGTGAPAGATGFLTSGVRGESTSGFGVLGMSRFSGVRGDLLNTLGATLADGRLGYSIGGTNYGVFATGDIGATGTKFFVLPHPTDPSMVIRYISLEGPEAGTYYRGKAALNGRVAVLDVPESFRLVTDPNSLSIQITPIGRSASLWVEELGLDRIVIQGTRDVEFFYTVNGVRQDYQDFHPIAAGSEFMPGGPDATLPEALSEEARRRLITNGTYNSDGSVNLETAARLGWPNAWQRRPLPSR